MGWILRRRTWDDNWGDFQAGCPASVSVNSVKVLNRTPSTVGHWRKSPSALHLFLISRVLREGVPQLSDACTERTVTNTSTTSTFSLV